MYPLVEPRQRPERFLLNRFSPLAESAAFLGLGGFDAAGSVWYPDARRLLGAVPNDGTLTNMDPATDWVWSPELGRWATDFDGSNEYVLCPAFGAAVASSAGWSLSWWGLRRTSVNAAFDHIIGWKASFSGLIAYKTTGNVALLSSAGAPVHTWNSAWSEDLLWHHWVFNAYSASSCELFRDGVSLGAAAQDADTLTQLSIARLLDGTVEFNGKMSDVIAASWPRTPAEIEILANPDPMIGGWILPPRRVAFPAAVAEPSGFKPYWARRSSQIIGGGIA